MTKRSLITLIFLLTVFIDIIAENCNVQNCRNIINSIHYEFFTTKYDIFGTTRGRGGAILIKDNYLIYGRAQNDFIRINIDYFKKVIDVNSKTDINLNKINSTNYEKNFLPNIITNFEALKQSKRYLYKEFEPKIEGLIFHNGYYYCTYEKYEVDTDDIYFVLAKIKLGQKNWTEIYKTPPLKAPYLAMGTGGKMVVRGDIIYFTVGDFSLDRINGLPNDLASQNPKLPWGKVMAIDVNNLNGAFVYSIGHRNPQGLLVLKDGRILESEHGPKGGDELNFITKGGNYGWPFTSYGTKYNSFEEYNKDIQSPKINSKFIEPLFAFLPDAGITNLIQINNFKEKWQQDIVMGSLKAESIYRIRISSDRVIFSEQIYLGYRIRELAEHGKSIFMLTDDGAILKMDPIITQ